MGMFDYFRSSYDLGEQFTNTECQTKDIEEFGIGGSMTHYWLDPAGKLWYMDLSHTADLHIINEGDPEYSEKHKFLNFQWRSNGIHGKVKPHFLTKYIEVYISNYKGDWESWPTLRLHFKQGILQEYEYQIRWAK